MFKSLEGPLSSFRCILDGSWNTFMPVSSSPLPQRSTTDRSAGVGRAAPGWMCPVQGAEPGEPGEPWELRSASKITQKLINMVVQWLYNVVQCCTMVPWCRLRRWHPHMTRATPLLYESELLLHHTACPTDLEMTQLISTRRTWISNCNAFFA